MEEPRCPACGAGMKLRTAKRGHNAGNQFWGCREYPRCKQIVDFKEPRPLQETPVERNARDPRSWNRVQWHDATLTRRGWRTYYATVGVSLRRLPSPLWETVKNCWIATEKTSTQRNPSESVLNVVASMRKILSRGLGPPLHPAAETQLLAVNNTRTLGKENFVPPPSDRPLPFDLGLTDESLYEKELVQAWETLDLTLTRWIIPQPAFDSLIYAASDSKATRNNGQRRGDFLAVTDGECTLWEIDGQQHKSQQHIDKKRDRELAAAGMETIRVTTSAIRERNDTYRASLKTVQEMAPDYKKGCISSIVWPAVLTHRLVIAICEALVMGYLTGDNWDIVVSDPTGLSPELLGPYLEMLDAFDLMWGKRT